MAIAMSDCFSMHCQFCEIVGGVPKPATDSSVLRAFHHFVSALKAEVAVAILEGAAEWSATTAQVRTSNARTPARDGHSHTCTGCRHCHSAAESCKRIAGWHCCLQLCRTTILRPHRHPLLGCPQMQHLQLRQLPCRVPHCVPRYQ
jgi:hypothetical protein